MPEAIARYDLQMRCDVSWKERDVPVDVVIDMIEEREPDEHGNPGKLISARLAGYSASRIISVKYARIKVDDRMAWRLIIGGHIQRHARPHRRWLRWRDPDDQTVTS